jgi:hypothetical protein
MKRALTIVITAIGLVAWVVLLFRYKGSVAAGTATFLRVTVAR